MSKGMWTKNVTSDGSVFYFNASQNKSSWKLPSDAVIHEAPNLKPLVYIEEMKPEDAEKLKNLEAILQFSSSVEDKPPNKDSALETAFLPMTAEAIELP